MKKNNKDTFVITSILDALFLIFIPIAIYNSVNFDKINASIDKNTGFVLMYVALICILYLSSVLIKLSHVIRVSKKTTSNKVKIYIHFINVLVPFALLFYTSKHKKDQSNRTHQF